MPSAFRPLPSVIDIYTSAELPNFMKFQDVTALRRRAVEDGERDVRNAIPVYLHVIFIPAVDDHARVEMLAEDTPLVRTEEHHEIEVVLIGEARDQAIIKHSSYPQGAARFYNCRVKERAFLEGYLPPSAQEGVRIPVKGKLRPN